MPMRAPVWALVLVWVGVAVRALIQVLAGVAVPNHLLRGAVWVTELVAAVSGLVLRVAVSDLVLRVAVRALIQMLAGVAVPNHLLRVEYYHHHNLQHHLHRLRL